jgi:hypothetical protein
VVVTVKLPDCPVANDALAPLVIAGAWLTVRVKLWVAAGETPFDAVIVNG